MKSCKLKAQDTLGCPLERKHGLDHDRLPSVEDYYWPIFGELHFNASGWVSVR